MKTFIISFSIFFSLLIFPRWASCATFRLVDGKIQFAVAQINGKIYWTTQERDDFLSAYASNGSSYTLNTVNFTPTNFEITVSTSGIAFANYSDAASCITDKDYLTDRLDDLRASEIRKNRRTIDYLKIENAKR